MCVTDLPIPGNALVAINQQYADFNASVKEGDEIAFFPPVTGG
jgi:molybdopterin synthase sulfur carrier subunit